MQGNQCCYQAREQTQVWARPALNAHLPVEIAGLNSVHVNLKRWRTARWPESFVGARGHGASGHRQRRRGRVKAAWHQAPICLFLLVSSHTHHFHVLEPRHGQRLQQLAANAACTHSQQPRVLHLRKRWAPAAAAVAAAAVVGRGAGCGAGSCISASPHLCIAAGWESAGSVWEQNAAFDHSHGADFNSRNSPPAAAAGETWQHKARARQGPPAAASWLGSFLCVRKLSKVRVWVVDHGHRMGGMPIASRHGAPPWQARAAVCRRSPAGLAGSAIAAGPAARAFEFCFAPSVMIRSVANA